MTPAEVGQWASARSDLRLRLGVRARLRRVQEPEAPPSRRRIVCCPLYSLAPLTEPTPAVDPL